MAKNRIQGVDAVNEQCLIALVEKYPQLYNFEHPDYFSLSKKEKIWDDIGSKLNSDGRTVRDFWKSIRDNYRKALKLRSTKTGKVRKPKFHKELSFLTPYMTVNAAEKETEKVSSDVTATSTSVAYSGSVFIPECSLETDQSNLPEIDSSDPLISFFLSMAKTVKTFSVREQLRIKSEIFQIVHRTEIKEMTKRYSQSDICITECVAEDSQPLCPKTELEFCPKMELESE